MWRPTAAPCRTLIWLPSVSQDGGPAAPGSALVDLEGRWVGLVGRIVTARQTNTVLMLESLLPKLAAELQGHITPATAMIGLHTGGAWLAERVWEPDLPTSLVKAGYQWTILDDQHFRAAAIPEGTVRTLTMDFASNAAEA